MPLNNWMVDRLPTRSYFGMKGTDEKQYAESGRHPQSATSPDSAAVIHSHSHRDNKRELDDRLPKLVGRGAAPKILHHLGKHVHTLYPSYLSIFRKTSLRAPNTPLKDRSPYPESLQWRQRQLPEPLHQYLAEGALKSGEACDRQYGPMRGRPQSWAEAMDH